MFSKCNNMSLSNTDAPSNFEALSTVSDKLQIHPFYRGSHINLKVKFLFSKYAKNFFGEKQIKLLIVGEKVF